MASLKPTITAVITDEQAQKLKSDIQTNAPGILGLYLVINDMPATTPVAGSYQLKGRSLSFSPAYALGGDLEFEIQYKQDENLVASKRLRTPPGKSSGIITKAITSYPLSDTIPYNTLFFHVRFSRQMSPDREAYRHVRVYDENGVERARAWRQRSFWLDSGRLLVLMIHPGRVKNGIRYEGPLFDTGKYYKLVVDKAIRDGSGNPIAAEYTKQYFVAGEDRVLPKANINYKKLPRVNTSDPLLLSFSEGMDHASVIDGTTLYDSKGEQVPCRIKTLNDDNYQVMPSHKWGKGKYTLVLKSAVYDFAANRIGRPFEIKDAQEVEKDKLFTMFDFEAK